MPKYMFLMSSLWRVLGVANTASCSGFSTPGTQPVVSAPGPIAETISGTGVSQGKTQRNSIETYERVDHQCQARQGQNDADDRIARPGDESRR